MTITDPDKLSRKPSQIRRRLRRTTGNTPEKRARLERDLAIMQEADPRYKPIEEWDWEELARGRPRDKEGKFRGAAPSWLDNKLREEAKRRLKERVHDALNVYARQALRVLQRTMIDESVDIKIRLDTAKFVIEHVIGKATVKQEIKAEGIGFIARALVMEDPEDPGHMIPAHPTAARGQVIDGEWSEEDDDD